MKIINASEVDAFEAEKRRDRHTNNFSSVYLALGYMMLIAFLCIVGGSLIQLVDILTARGV